MGRAYEVRKASIQKNGLVKAKLYSNFAKEIYLAAKNGGTDPDSNANLKRLMDQAKKNQVPSDIVKRAIDKVNSGVDENYTSCRYEGFGPGGCTVIVDCLTDNVNRTVGFVRSAFTKTNGKLGTPNSVSHFYENLALFGVKGYEMDDLFEKLAMEDVDIKDIEKEDDLVFITADAKEYNNIRKALMNIDANMDLEIDEIAMVPLEKITLTLDEDKEMFDKLLTMLDDIEDVQNVYHNVENG